MSNNTSKPTITPIDIVNRFNQPGDLTVASIQRMLMRHLLNHAANHEESMLGEQDFYAMYELTEILEQIEAWFHKQPNPVTMQRELYKQGISITKANEFFLFVNNKLAKSKDYNPELAETMLKLMKLVHSK